ncbi:MAG TPA: hypothetical protein VFJ80_04550 [Candidatus Limnocylindrales bacterium]|nr:hypothetical protein [Candidatus Limnocylindrales bacterium]
MNAEFNWWLLVVGLVVGAGLVWVVLLDGRRREVDVDESERPREAIWLSQILAEEGQDITPETAERMLILHRAYLEAPPPDDPSALDPGSEAAADDRIGLERRATDVRQ